MTPRVATRTLVVLGVALLVGGVSGCAGSAPVTARTDGQQGAAPCPPPDGAGSAMIDWVDFVHAHGRTYSALGSAAATVPAAAVGPVDTTVRCRIADVVGSPSYRMRDGDAAFLPEGTQLHTFGDARPELRLTARVDGTWRVYEVLDDESARTGADLLDLSGGVSGIDLLDGETGQQVLASVDDPDVVRRVVAAVLAAPVLATAPDDLGDPVFLRFRLADGTTVTRAWHRPAGVLALRVEAPAVLDEAFPQH